MQPMACHIIFDFYSFIFDLSIKAKILEPTIIFFVVWDWHKWLIVFRFWISNSISKHGFKTSRRWLCYCADKSETIICRQLMAVQREGKLHGPLCHNTVCLSEDILYRASWKCCAASPKHFIIIAKDKVMARSPPWPLLRRISEMDRRNTFNLFHRIHYESAKCCGARTLRPSLGALI